MPDTTKTLREPKDTIKREYMKFANSRWGHGQVDKTPTLYLSHIEIADWWIEKMKAHDEELMKKIEELETMQGGDPENHIAYVAKSDVLSLLSPSSDNNEKPYHQIDHTHCFNQENPPCGLKGKHRCCLCGISSDSKQIYNPECKHCGLLRSTIRETGHFCVTRPIGSTANGQIHEFDNER